MTWPLYRPSTFSKREDYERPFPREYKLLFVVLTTIARTTRYHDNSRAKIWRLRIINAPLCHFTPQLNMKVLSEQPVSPVSGSYPFKLLNPIRSFSTTTALSTLYNFLHHSFTAQFHLSRIMGTFNLFPFPLVFGDLIFVLHLILFIYLFFFVWRCAGKVKIGINGNRS